MPTFTAAFSVFEMGYCQPLDYAVFAQTTDSGTEIEEQAFLTLVDSFIVLEPNAAFDHIEAWVATFEVRSEGIKVLELTFNVTVSAVHCSEIDVTFSFAAPLEFLLGQQLSAALEIPEAQDAQELLANGLCGDLTYSLIGVV